MPRKDHATELRQRMEESGYEQYPEITPATGYIDEHGHGIQMGPRGEDRYEDHNALGYPYEVKKQRMKEGRLVRFHAQKNGGLMMIHSAHKITKAQAEAIREAVRRLKPESVEVHGPNDRKDPEKYEYPHPDELNLAAPSSVIVKVPLPQPVSQAPQQPPTLKKPSRKLSYVLPI